MKFVVGSMKSTVRWIALAKLSITPVAFGAIVSLESFKCESGHVLQIQNVALSCNGINECHMGQVSTLDGELTLSEDLDSDEIYVDAVLKKFHVPLFNLYHRFPTEFCDETISTSGADCPAAGDYAFSADVTIPFMNRFVTGWTVTAAADFFDDHDRLVGKCAVVVATRSSWGGNVVSASAAAVGGLALAGLLVRRRRRRLRTTTEDFGETNFSRMTDQVELSRKTPGFHNVVTDKVVLTRTITAEARMNAEAAAVTAFL